MKNEKKNQLENIYSTRPGCRHLVKISGGLSDLTINYTTHGAKAVCAGSRASVQTTKT